MAAVPRPVAWLLACFLLSGCATSRPPDAFLKALKEHPEETALVRGVPPYSSAKPRAEFGPLSSVLRFWKRTASPSSLERWYAEHAAGTDPLHRPALCALDHGLWALASSGSPAKLKARLRCGIPVIALLQTNALDPSTRRYPVVIGYDDRGGQILCHTGAARPVLVPWADFLRAWRVYDHWMLVICPPEAPCWHLDGNERVSRGRFYEATRQPAEALGDYEAALKLESSDAGLRVRLGNVYRALGRDGDAERAYRLAIAEDPHNAKAYNNLAYLLAEQARALDEAVALARQALILEPTSPLATDTLGFALYQQGKYGEAADVLERARARARDLPADTQIDIGLHLVRAQVRSGQEHLARQVLSDLARRHRRLVVPADLRPLLKPRP
ncbi:MAG: tetratricopeptide repeat protein [Verrucomicrobiota bacterium]